MIFVAVGWGLVAAVFDGRTAVVGATYGLAAAAAWAWPGAMFEIFGSATVAAFVLLALAWRGALRPPK
jgi:hypothetical protein